MKKYILFLWIIAGMCSCNDLLELQNDGRISMDEIFTTYNGVRGYLSACYGYRIYPSYDRSSLCDDAHDSDGTYANSLFSFWYGNAFSSSFFFSTDFGIKADTTAWTNYFQGIRKCNVFLENMAKIDASAFATSKGEPVGWVAQAKTLRAFYYLQLIKRYGSVPLITEQYSMAHDYSADQKSSFSEIVTQILKDCDEALATPDIEGGFSWEVRTGQSGIMTRAVAYAIKSEAVTYAASPYWSDGVFTWADATRINAEALYQCTTHGYTLWTAEPAPDVAQNAYAFYFITRPDELRATDKETIYGNAVVNVWQSSGMPSTAGQIKAGSCPTQELVDSYEMANGQMPVLGYADRQHLNPIINTASGYDANNPYVNRDPRFYASIYYNGAARTLSAPLSQVETFIGAVDGISTADRRTTHTGYYLRKYNNWKSNRDNNADGAVRIFRVAELYLNFAESACYSHGPDVAVQLGGSVSMSAREAVSKIRERAGMPPFPTGMSAADFEKKYRNERRIELAFEEHRFFDVRRWKILEETERYVTGMRITQENGNLIYTRTGFERGSWVDKYYLYPIPQSEVNKMQDHTGTNWQNPGWN